MATPKTSAHHRFLIQTQALQSLLAKEHKEKDKGLAFYKAGARNVIFRLEGLCRVYRDIEDKKFFNEWYRTFKSMEDLMGRMDNYEAMWNEFSKYKELKSSAAKLLEARFNEESKALSEQLKNDGWLSGERIHDFETRLLKVKWESEKDDQASFAAAIVGELDKLTDQYANGEINVQNLESGLHEFRRRLRWAGIYSQAANGMIQLSPVGHVAAGLIKYCTKDIVSLPYNQMAKSPKGVLPVHIQAHYFYALSWMIQYLGELKDCSLRFNLFNELMKDAKRKDKAIEKRFRATCDFAPDEIAALAEEAIDAFIYTDLIPERIARDVMRAMMEK